MSQQDHLEERPNNQIREETDEGRRLVLPGSFPFESERMGQTEGQFEESMLLDKCNDPNGLSRESGVWSPTDWTISQPKGGNAAARRLPATALQPSQSKTGRRTPSTHPGRRDISYRAESIARTQGT